MIDISFIVPTRGRPEKMMRFLDGVAETTSDLDQLEVVLVVDEDDVGSHNFSHSKVKLKIVKVPPGLTMGALNRAGYAASSGRNIMLLNDDIVIRTAGWDSKIKSVISGYPDEIYLVHVNDKLFEEKLCTFPFVSRRYCELVGEICHENYRRYRIDDHIYNIFNQLSFVGHCRIFYLPEVVFEHENFVTDGSGKRYTPNEEILAIDAIEFEAVLPKRKEQTMAIFRLLEAEKAKPATWIAEKKLERLQESFSIRSLDYVRVLASKRTGANSRVTIGVVSADIRNDYAKKCLELVKAYTTNYDLIVLDNNRGPNFNHSTEMNRILALAKTDLVVLMDDDVFVGPGWLDGLLACLDDDTPVVSPVHLDKDGKFSYSGVCITSDGSGDHSHFIDIPQKPRVVPTICSALLLIDMAKLPGIRMNESYKKYFMDIDFGLAVWERGFKVVVTPDVVVTHIGGATMRPESLAAFELYKDNVKIFQKNWLHSGRLEAIEQGPWSKYEMLKNIRRFADNDPSLFERHQGEDFDAYLKRLWSDRQFLEKVPVLQHKAAINSSRFLRRVQGQVSAEEFSAISKNIFPVHYVVPQLAMHDYNGFNIIEDLEFVGIPQSEGSYSRKRLKYGGFYPVFKSQSLEEVKSEIDKYLKRKADVEGLNFTERMRHRFLRFVFKNRERVQWRKAKLMRHIELTMKNPMGQLQHYWARLSG